MIMVSIRASAHQKARRPGGLTLVEVLIAIGLIGIITGATFMFWGHLDSGRTRIRTHIDRRQAARVFLDRVERDLFGVIVADGKHGSGINGTESSLALLTRRVNMPDALHGTTGAYRDLQQVSYQFNEGSRTLTASVQSLMGDASTNNSSGSAETISDDLGLVRFRYHNGRSWSNSFSSESSNQLPSAIEVAVWFDSPRMIDSAEDLSMEPDDDLMNPGEANPFDPERGSESDLEPFMFDEDAAAFADEFDDESNWPLPDRLRVIVIPDGPEFDTGRSYEDVVVTSSPSPLPSVEDDGGSGE